MYAQSFPSSGSIFAAPLSSLFMSRIGFNPVLSASTTSGVAPLGVVFNAVGTTHPLTTNPFRDLLYFFDFGDGSSATYTYGELAGLLKRRFVGGPVSGYVYETPGTYTARVWAYDGVTLSLAATQTITVTDPDVVYTQANTYYIHPSVLPVPGVDGVPSDAVMGNCILQSNLATILNTYCISNKRVLLRSGQSFSKPTGAALSNRKSVYFSTYGGAAKANLLAGVNNTYLIELWAAGNAANNPNNWRILNMNFDGNTYTGVRAIQATFTQTVAGDAGVKSISDGYFTVHGCDAVGCSVGFIASGTGHVVSKFMFDNVLAAGTFVSGGNGFFPSQVLRLACIDSYFDNRYNGEHCSRMQGGDYVTYISNSYRRPSTTKNYQTSRGWGVGSIANGVDAMYIQSSYNTFDATGNTQDGTGYLHVGPQNSGVNEPIRDVIIEGNFFNQLGVIADARAMEFVFRRGIARNNVIRGAASPATATKAIYFVNSNANMAPVVTEDIKLIGNTVYSATVNGFTAVEVQSAVSNIEVRGMLGYAPFATKTGDNNGTAPSMFTGAGLGNSGNVYNYNSSNAQMKSTDPLFNGALTTKAGFKLQAGSPYVDFVAADAWHFMDSAGFLTGAVPHDAGALNNVNKQVDAWTLVP